MALKVLRGVAFGSELILTWAYCRTSSPFSVAVTVILDLWNSRFTSWIMRVRGEGGDLRRAGGVEVVGSRISGFRRSGDLVGVLVG